MSKAHSRYEDGAASERRRVDRTTERWHGGGETSPTDLGAPSKTELWHGVEHTADEPSDPVTVEPAAEGGARSECCAD